MNQGMLSSSSDEWETPQEFFDALDAVFHFTLDVCAARDNAKCERYFTKAEDGLSKELARCLLDESSVRARDSGFGKTRV
jgi:site-specific DNA-methyltransferase (adenine-specific)